MRCLLSSVRTMACMPAPPGNPAISVQTRSLENIISDGVVQDAIKSEGLNVRIKSIQLDSGYQFQLTNGCEFQVTRDNTNARPGACPELLPIKLINQVGCGLQN